MIFHDDLSNSLINELAILTKLALHFIYRSFDLLVKLGILFLRAIEIDMIVNFIFSSGLGQQYS